MTYNPLIHNRQTIRLKNYDYSREGRYFITLNVQDSHKLFGEIKGGKMILNSFGEIVKEEWLNSLIVRKNISLGEFIILPDHFHGIIQINYRIQKSEDAKPGEFKSPSNNIPAIIRGFKGASTKRIRSFLYKSTCRVELQNICRDELQNICRDELQFVPTNAELNLLKSMNQKKSIWQGNYYESIIRNEKHFKNVSNYIINNVQKHAYPRKPFINES